MTMRISYRAPLSEIFFEELERHTLAAGSTMTLDLSQLDAPDLSGNGLGQVREFDSTDPFVRCDPAGGMRQDRNGQLARGFVAWREDDECLRNDVLDGVRAGNDRGLGNRVMFDQHA